MAFETAKAYLEERGFGDRIIVPEHSSATVEAAAEAIGCTPAMIAKSLSFLLGEEAILVLAEGTARVDNKKYKDTFRCKAKMVPGDMVEKKIGHAVGGVCPFGVKEGVKVYLDESLKRHETVYPACGSDHSAVRLSVPELEQLSGAIGWVDVCKDSVPVE